MNLYLYCGMVEIICICIWKIRMNFHLILQKSYESLISVKDIFQMISYVKLLLSIDVICLQDFLVVLNYKL